MWSWKYHCYHWSPHAQIEFPCAVDVPQVCLHHSETHSSLELVPVPVSENISLWEGVLVWEITIFSVIVLFISLWEGVSVLE